MELSSQLLREDLTSGQAFAAWDRLLDTARTGPSYLRQPEIASLVKAQLDRAHADGLCELDRYVIMPNHVHTLWRPAASLAVLLRFVKGPTARSANEVLKREGQPFWEEEYFDRLVRTADEARRIRLYIAANPVRAGLVASPEEYLWRG
jgi:putative transposase